MRDGIGTTMRRLIDCIFCSKQLCGFHNFWLSQPYSIAMLCLWSHLSSLSSKYQSWSIPTHFLYITIGTFSWLRFLDSMKCLKMFQFCLIGHLLPLRMFIKAAYLSIYLIVCFERNACILLSDHDKKLPGFPWGYITL